MSRGGVAYQHPDAVEFDYALARSSPKGYNDRGLSLQQRRDVENYDNYGSNPPLLSAQESDEKLMGYVQQRAHENGPGHAQRQSSYHDVIHVAVNPRMAPYGTDSIALSPAGLRRQYQPGANKPTESCPFGTEAHFDQQKLFKGRGKVRMDVESQGDHLTSSLLVDELRNKTQDSFSHFHHPKVAPNETNPAQLNYLKNQSLGIFPPQEERSRERPRGVLIDFEKHPHEEKWGVVGVGPDPDLPPHKSGKAMIQAPAKPDPMLLSTNEEAYFSPQHRAKKKMELPWAKQPVDPPFAQPEINPFNDRCRENTLKGVAIVDRETGMIRPAPYGVDSGFGVPFDYSGPVPKQFGNLTNYRGKNVEKDQFNSNFARQHEYPYGRQGDDVPQMKLHKGRMDEKTMMERAKSQVPWGIPGEMNAEKYDPFLKNHKRMYGDAQVSDPQRNCITDPWN